MGLYLLSRHATATKSGDIYSGAGNWDITNPTVYRNESVTVDGDIIINVGGSLIFDNGSVDFSVPAATIQVNAPAQFIHTNLTNSAGTFNIEFNNADADFIFCEISKVTSNLFDFEEGYYNITSSTLWGVSLKFDHDGSYLWGRISNCTLHSEDGGNTNYFAVLAIDVDILLVIGNDINSQRHTGSPLKPISVKGYANLSIDNNTIHEFIGSIQYWTTCQYPPSSFQNNTFDDVGRGEWFTSGFSSINNSYGYGLDEYEWLRGLGTYDFYNPINLSASQINRDDTPPFENHFAIHYWVNLTVLDAFLTPLPDARVAVFDKDLTKQFDGHADASGRITYLWLTIQNDEDNLNPFRFRIEQYGQVYTESYTITESRNITIILENITWEQTLIVQMINNYTMTKIEFGNLLCYVNGDYIAFEELTLYDEPLINITIYDHFERCVYIYEQAVNYSRTRETILIYINYTTIQINQYDADTGEEVEWVKKWNLTLEDSDISYHFTGDEVGVPEVGGGENNYTLSWEANDNASAGSKELRNVTATTNTLPPSTHASKSTGYMIADVKVRTAATTSGPADKTFWDTLSDFFGDMKVKVVIGIGSIVLMGVAYWRFTKKIKKADQEMEKRGWL